MNYKKALKIILVIFLVQVLIKIILSSFIQSPTIFADEYDYIKMARNFFYAQKFFINGFPSHQYLPLYPMLISISYIFKDMNLVYFFAKCINAIVSSLVIFPAFLISKQFLTSKKAVLTAFVVSILPSSFSFVPYIMSENLFFFVMLFAIYFICKSYSSDKYRWDILAGLFIGLSYLTKIVGLILAPIIFILLIISLFKKEYSQVKKKIILLIVTFLTILPWLIRNMYYFGFGKSIFFGDVSIINENLSKFSILSFIDWIILHLGYIVLATGIILFIMSFLLTKYSKKDIKLFNLTLTTWIFLILIICFSSIIVSRGVPLHWFLTGKPLGRHIETIIPLFVILGFIGLNKNVTKEISNKVLLGITVFLFILLGASSQLNLFSLFPANNISLSPFGILKYILTTNSFTILAIIFLLLSLSFLVFYKLNLLKFKTCIVIFSIIFIVISLSNYAFTHYNSKSNWENLDLTQKGKWFNSYDKGKSKVLFDEECNLKSIITEENKPLAIMAFWMNNDLIVGDETSFDEVDYIISSKKLPYKILDTIEEDTFIYEK